MGLLIGGRGAIPMFFQDFWKEKNLNKSSLYKISIMYHYSTLSKYLKNQYYIKIQRAYCFSSLFILVLESRK